MLFLLPHGVTGLALTRWCTGRANFAVRLLMDFRPRFGGSLWDESEGDFAEGLESPTLGEATFALTKSQFGDFDSEAHSRMPSHFWLLNMLRFGMFPVAALCR